MRQDQRCGQFRLLRLAMAATLFAIGTAETARAVTSADDAYRSIGFL